VSLIDDEDLKVLREVAERAARNYSTTVTFIAHVTPQAVVALVVEVERARAASAAEGK
jgi:hypothetical protein